MKKKLLSFALALSVGLSLTSCNNSNNLNSDNSASKNTKKYNVGICQFSQHPALDAATEGFKDALEEALPGKINFQIENASNDIPTCGIICNGFVANEVDLILANATPCLQAAASATVDIPILGTAVTEYGVALDIKDFNGTVGGNISGTSDLSPLDKQAAMIPELFPNAKKVGIIYCSAEANSVYQAEVVKNELEKLNLSVNTYTFADSNDVSAVTATACDENDVLYMPTDNAVALCAEAINNVAEPAGIPIINGEANPCKICGVATLSIDYYELGRTTGNMAAQILTGEKNISEMPIEYYKNPKKLFNPSLAKTMNVTIPDNYEPIEE